MIHRLLTILALITLFSCSGAEKEENVSKQSSDLKPDSIGSEYPDLLSKSLIAHGGLDNWKSYGYLSFNLQTSSNSSNLENHTINLYNRKVFIDRDSVQVGFDGKQVWVAPNLNSFQGSSARFYHNLYFYFFGIPFLLTDPGINYEDLGIRTVNGNEYRALKISYNVGVGDSDDDIYIAHFNPETFQLELLLYTVTYFEENNEKYNALVYENWVKEGGLLVPTILKGYTFQNDSTGKMRYEVRFSDITFKSEEPDSSLFQMPENAEVSPLSK